ncbi:MAG TPA: hypothetical protein VMT66_08490 [Steroidobacteraceae bacterium]|nr:hypothetical protein [Steroidobacteraceae bacterium]
MEDETLKVGLLMEAAQAQQALAASALDRLREHTAGLDAIVREEIRTTLLEEMRTLAEDTRNAAAALRKLQRLTNLRLAAWGLVMPSLATLVPVAVAWWLLPSRGEIQSLAAQRDQLAMNISRLSHQGGKVELRHCGSAQRLCVHVERSAPAYGTGGDFLVVKGY